MKLRQLFRFRKKGAIILLYHRVTQLDSDPQWLSVAPGLFARQLERLRADWQILSLAELLGHMQENTVPRRAAVLTFDDGYADNLLEAKPLLEKFDVPATVFVTTGNTGGGREFFWDELEGILLGNTEAPESFSFEHNGKRFIWQTKYHPKPGWNVAMPEDPSPRHKMYRELTAMVRDMEATQREATLRMVADWIGVKRQIRPGHRCLTAAEIVDLARGGLVEIGAHTVTHSVLSNQSPAAQQREMAESKSALEKILGRPASFFSYPFGRREDYSAGTPALARQSGFAAACSNFPGLVRADTDPFQLPRVLARDWPPEELTAHLNQCYV